MAYDPSAPNYGRAQRGQLSPFRDTAQRRHPAFEEEEEQAQQQAPDALAQAIYPQPQAAQAKPVFSKQKTQPIVDQARSEAGSSSGALMDATGPARRASASRMSASPGPLTYSASDSQGKLTSAPSAASPLEQAIAPGGAGGGAGYSLSGRGGSGGGSNQFTGFDFDQSDANRDTGKSAKYAFADLAAQSGVAMPTTKADAEAWARQYIVPGMNALGHEVLDVKGDKMLVRNWQGEGWVDFLVNADGANPQLAWQAEGGAGAADPLASAVGGSAADPVAMTLAQQLGIDTSNPLWKQILDQLIADQSGQTGNTPPHATVRV